MKKKSPQQRYLEKEVDRVPCACGCGEEVIRRRVHFFPSQTLPRFIFGHQGVSEKALKALRVATEKRRGLRGPKTVQWKGGRHYEKRGFVSIWTIEGHVHEHRVIAERHLGRKLRSDDFGRFTKVRSL